jgi:hypothetical protein
MVPGMISVPKIAYEPKITLRTRKAAMKIYRNCPIATFVFSEKLKCFRRKAFRIRVNKSM